MFKEKGFPRIIGNSVNGFYYINILLLYHILDCKGTENKYTSVVT